MREGTYPPRGAPEHCRQPQRWQLGALCVDRALLGLPWGSPVLGRDCQCHPLLLAIISGGQGTDGRESGRCCLHKVSVGSL